MKKVTNIHIGGRVIPIEDSAFDKLHEFVEGLHRRYAADPRHNEIVDDVENRISALMSEKIGNGAASITDAHVAEITASISLPESTSPPRATESPTNSNSEKRRLYRNSSDKFIGGVCSGIAAYLDIDPSIVRLVFAILAFSGWGLLLYLILWIVIPAKEQPGFTGRRFYRDVDNKVLGGVASGIAGYFDWDIKVVRLIFIAPFIINILFGVVNWPFFIHGFWLPSIVFGSLTGTFVLAYIVLWIILPASHTGSKKKAISSEQRDSRPMTYETNSVGHAIGVLFRIFFLFIAGIIAFSLFAALAVFLFGGVILWPIHAFLWTSLWQEYLAYATLILFLGLPLFGIFIWLVRRIIGVKSESSFLRWTFGLLWSIGWIAAILLVISIAQDIRYYDSSAPIDVPLVTQPKDDLLIVAVSEPILAFAQRYWWNDGSSTGWDFTDEKLKLSFVKFKILPSQDKLFHVAIKKFSAGSTHDDAMKRASQVHFRAVYSDGVLDLGNGFEIDQGNKYRGQSVEVDISVPVGKKIRFDDSITDKLNPVNINIHNERGWAKGSMSIDVNDDPFPWQTSLDYTMGVNGELNLAF